MSIHFDILAFQHVLLNWFSRFGRDLPWRNSYLPYHVWLSEIMLQQTQMERGVAYFTRWIKRFPDVQSVAEADSNELHKYWEGLGYYSRVKNLHLAAKLIVDQYHSTIPTERHALKKLPGIGDYTASAISSIAFEQDVVVVDGNVERIFARIFDISSPVKSKGGHARIVGLAKDLLPPGKARYFNQALMDLGGTICRPRNPDCGICPVSTFCLAYQGNFVDERPVKKKVQSIIPINMATGLLVHKGYVFVQQRNDDDIWGGLWEFPGGRIEKGETPADCVVREYAEETGFTIENCEKITTVTHYHTKYKVTLHCYTSRLCQDSILPELNAAQNYHWITADQLGNYAFPAGHRKFIEFARKFRPEILTKDCGI